MNLILTIWCSKMKWYFFWKACILSMLMMMKELRQGYSWIAGHAFPGSVRLHTRHCEYLDSIAFWFLYFNPLEWCMPQKRSSASSLFHKISLGYVLHPYLHIVIAESYNFVLSPNLSLLPAPYALFWANIVFKLQHNLSYISIYSTVRSFCQKKPYGLQVCVEFWDSWKSFECMQCDSPW